MKKSYTNDSLECNTQLAHPNQNWLNRMAFGVINDNTLIFINPSIFEIESI